MIKNVKIGADPEMFLFDIKENKYISVEGLIGGTKESPIIISHEGYCLQEDNVMVEFNIPPAHTKAEFVNSIQYMISYINTILPSNLITKIEPAAYFDWEQLLTDQSMTFGCSPDLNAWTNIENEKPMGESTNLRTCGGHIHIGYDSPNAYTSLEIIKALDFFLGVPLSVLEPANDRKVLYGNFGACRLKKYGVEYRTPSNYWLTSSNMIEFVFEQVQKAIQYVNNSAVIDYFYEEIYESITNNNSEAAYKLIETHGICELEKIKILK
jgi:hypothetical protein